MILVILRYYLASTGGPNKTYFLGCRSVLCKVHMYSNQSDLSKDSFKMQNHSCIPK